MSFKKPLLKLKLKEQTASKETYSVFKALVKYYCRSFSIRQLYHFQGSKNRIEKQNNLFSWFSNWSFSQFVNVLYLSWHKKGGSHYLDFFMQIRSRRITSIKACIRFLMTWPHFLQDMFMNKKRNHFKFSSQLIHCKEQQHKSKPEVFISSTSILFNAEANPGFPRGISTRKGALTYHSVKFSWKLHQNKESWTERGRSSNILLSSYAGIE